MLVSESAEFYRGPVDGQGEFIFDQERLARDVALTQRIQAGYTPADPTPDLPKPRIVDGKLDADASEALAELWQAYTPAARKAARRLLPKTLNKPGFDFDDLMQEAFYGLYHAAVVWRPEKDVTFLTNANDCMENHMTRGIMTNETTIRLPITARQRVKKAMAVMWRLYERREHFPHSEETADALGMSIRDFDAVRHDEALTSQMGSIDGGYYADDRDRHSTYESGQGRWRPIDPSAQEAEAVEDQVIFDELYTMVWEALRGVLSEREIYIIRERFLMVSPKTLSEVGRELGIQRERVRQVEAKALARLRRPEISDKMRAYLDKD